MRKINTPGEAPPPFRTEILPGHRSNPGSVKPLQIKRPPEVPCAPLQSPAIQPAVFSRQCCVPDSGLSTPGTHHEPVFSGCFLGAVLSGCHPSVFGAQFQAPWCVPWSIQTPSVANVDDVRFPVPPFPGATHLSVTPVFEPDGVSPKTRMVCPRAAHDSRTQCCRKATKHSRASGATHPFLVRVRCHPSVGRPRFRARWRVRCHPSIFRPGFKPNGVSPETRMVCPQAANGSRTHRCLKAPKHSHTSGATHLLVAPRFRARWCVPGQATAAELNVAEKPQSTPGRRVPVGCHPSIFRPSFRPWCVPWSIRTPFVGHVDDAEKHHCENSDPRGPLVPRTPSNLTRRRLMVYRYQRPDADWQRPVPASNAIARAGKLSRISLAAMFSPRFNRRALPR